jgi:hypothetical protein
MYVDTTLRIQPKSALLFHHPSWPQKTATKATAHRVASAEAAASVAGCRRMLSCASTRTDSYYTVTAVVSRLRLQHGLSIAGAPTQSSLTVCTRLCLVAILGFSWLSL